MEKLETCQRFAERAITKQVKTTPVEAIFAEANLPKIGTRATQICAIALEKSKRITPKIPRHQIAEQSSRQRMKKPSWRAKAGAVWESIFGNTSLAKQPELLSPWMQIGKLIFENSGSTFGDAETDKKWALHDWRKAETPSPGCVY